MGNVTVERDFLDVRDVVNGYAACPQRVAGEAYNLCSGTARPLSYFLDCMTEGRSVHVEVESDACGREVDGSAGPGALGLSDGASAAD